MINFVLCFDKNYNDVAHLFLHTLLNKVNEKINVYIIHNNPDSFFEIKKKLSDNKYLNEIFIYDVQLNNYLFIRRL